MSVCQTVQPHCAECPLESICLAKRHDLIGEIPVKTPPKKRRLEDKTVCILECGNQVGLNKRDDSGLLASLYELPNREGHLAPEEVPEAFGLDPGEIVELEPVGPAKAYLLPCGMAYDRLPGTVKARNPESPTLRRKKKI